jgi:superfamily I DNA and/or RNA helicase
MNSTQQELIEQQIYILRDTDREVAKYLDEWKNKLESFFVKNLENVQGDERDYIFVSTVYGPETKNRKVAQRFGPINGKYGHRRLNVLFTRAKYGLKVFTSLKDSDIIISPASSEGLKIFQEYLTYAGN